jgi:hypothetical protein
VRLVLQDRKVRTAARPSPAANRGKGLVDVRCQSRDDLGLVAHLVIDESEKPVKLYVCKEDDKSAKEEEEEVRDESAETGSSGFRRGDESDSRV